MSAGGDDVTREAMENALKVPADTKCGIRIAELEDLLAEHVADLDPKLTREQWPGSLAARTFEALSATGEATAEANYPTLDDRNPASVVGVPWNEQGYADPGAEARS